MILIFPNNLTVVSSLHSWSGCFFGMSTFVVIISLEFTSFFQATLLLLKLYIHCEKEECNEVCVNH